MKKSSFKFCWEDTLLEMLPSRALFLPETKELLICDIHLGKAEYFQQNGIPLTNNSDKNNFARIKKIVKKYSPEKLIILGDLFHSKYSIDKTLQKTVEDLPELLKTNVELVLGNHDVGCDIKNIKIFNIRKTKNITFSHEPVNSENKKNLNICGHYHPKINIKNNGDQLSFRCFAMDKNKNTLFLPAFGDLTGGYPCKNSFKKWAIISEEEIVEIKS
ncbi:ligase-associated DNA damage response endonuclease PdeM [Prochlorococcus marinus]|uniref:ligase-associated DNA damage response endonuclease PdeM n=1 Tax=Prochlorococcus marinus TaxID=1219 RepID=UPI001ADD05E5|nr:ligase-associated DNA damage response endonuclease PdeM [Prochlorococcus marinus]MBO8217055.1 ligase-associated DNA damage response endonuclease PdeM [Prochlorococcus marinus XMU1405]MBW3040283.1 metallophosphatase [Prochlorococcus marinus str. MU1405]MBW3047741.1 metallophosphatase [Prochlorococcus marinus str. MU1406]